MTQHMSYGCLRFPLLQNRKGFSKRLFKELADDSDILKAAAFDQAKLSGIHESFWRPAGMLCRCLPTGNPTAFNTIRKNAEILNDSYRILKRDLFRGKMILFARSTALEIANTRARKKALADAIDVGLLKYL
ncbi:hypothetical protein AABB24_025261 [Solanum stoloniferum]|uniref:Uncharacterized protein n=1 Tax=Solanum stoloniferum TaxID=62892 RepID=A0ABD2SS06_9SOLN